jgi:hypothetical protein
MTRDYELLPYKGNLPVLHAQASRQVEVQFARQAERILATAEIGMTGMSEMSEVERHATFKVATTAAAAELLAKGAAATRPNPTVTPAEQETQQRLFEDYTYRMAQLAEITNIKIIQAVDRATEQLGKRTFADTLEDIDARLTDAIIGRPNRPGLPNGRR